MGDLDIEIKVSTSNAEAEIRRVYTEAGRAEDGFAKLKKTTKETNQTFEDLARLVHQGSKAQAEMLARIHGPAEQAARDFGTLEALMRKGKITTEQYAAEVDRLAAALHRVPDGVGNVFAHQRNQTSRAMDTISLGDTPSAASGGFLASKAGQLAGGLTAGYAVSKILELDSSFAHAENSLRKFADTDAQLNVLLAHTTDVAYELHMNMEEGAKVFGEVGEATANLYLTQKEQVEVMKGLGEIAQNDGGDIGEMLGMVKQLTFAMDAGTISGRELKGMMKQSDDVAQIWVDTLGMSRTQLIAQANAGKIGEAQLRQMIIALRSTSETQQKHEERTISLTERAKDLAHRAFEPLSVSIGRYRAALEDSWEPLNKTIKLNELLYDKLSAALDKMGQTTQLARMSSGFVGLADVLKNANQQLKDYDEVAKLTGMDVRATYHDAVDKLNRALDSGIISQAQFTEGMKAAAKAAGMVAAEVHGARKEIESTSLDELRAAIANARPIEHLRDGEHWMTAESLKAPTFGTTWEETASQMERNSTALQKMADDMAESEQKKREKALEDWATSTQKQMDVLADALKPVEDAFVELFKTGEFGFKKMIDAMLEDLIRLSVQKGTASLLNLAFTGSTSSPAEQAAAAIGSAAINGGNHAFGGAFITPGVGGQDSVPVMFRLTPGERVDFTPPGGTGSTQSQRTSEPARPLNVVLEDRRDSRALLATADFDRAVLNVNRRYPTVGR